MRASRFVCMSQVEAPNPTLITLTETRDARLNTKEKGEELMSDQMRRLKRTFAWNHAMTIHLNLISIGAIVVYGWRLAGRMTVQ